MSEPRKLHICRRCGLKAKKIVRGYKYCTICARVVDMMGHLEQFGAPVGFPGAPPGVPEAAGGEDIEE